MIMSDDTIGTHGLHARWTRAGVLFNTAQAAQSPDLERLLIDTSKAARDDARLFIMAATWLCRYSTLIAKHRLKRLILDELPAGDRAPLGLLLDTARQQTGEDRFSAALAECSPAPAAQPFFSIERSNPALARLAKRRASDLSRRWNLWMPAFEAKYDALRPATWIVNQNPAYAKRADFRGDLRATILIELHDNPASGESELALARFTGTTRAAVRDALADLELGGHIFRKAGQNRLGAALVPAAAA